ncbi:MAG TPA: alpha/beta fold hydrolase [Herpetosiphonaceae bacterium]|nr:alpha/beta fold hydrolase [Herpetosiphonaceae bacterium]
MQCIYRLTLIAVLLGLAACRSEAGPTPAIEGMFDVGGFKLYLRCLDQRAVKSPAPLVILEHGIGERATSEMWREVQNQVAEFAPVCRFDRAGVGNSERPPTANRGGGDLVREERALLAAAGLKPPYLLVGHSFGGFPARLYAGAHPGEVVGMVLADVAHEDMIGEIPLGPEALDAADIGAAVREAGPLDIPLVVLTRGRDRSERWEAFQRDLLELSPNSVQRFADSDHQIPVRQPAAVADAIRLVLDAAERGAPLR